MKQTGYLAITFVIGWGIQLALILTNHTQDALYNALYPVLMLTPALAVFATKYAIKEPLWYQFWLKPQGRKTWLYSIAGWLCPVVLIAAGSVLFFVIFPEQYDGNMSVAIETLRGNSRDNLKDFTDADIISTLRIQMILNIVLAPFYNFFASVGEEIGWRGYFLAMLCEKHPKWRAVLINGAVWGLWYFPMVIGMGLYCGKDVTGYPVVNCLVALVYYMVLGVLYSYFTIKTQSCIPAILANACVATMSGVGTLFLVDSQKTSVFLNPMPTSVVGGMGFIVVAGILLYLFAKDKVQPAAAKEEADVSVYNKKKQGQTASLKSHLQNKHLNQKK